MNNRSDAKKGPQFSKCVKKVHPHQLQKNQSKHVLWWENQFKELEKTSRIPDYKKQKCLRSIFSDKEIEKFAKSGADIIKEQKSPRDRKVSSDFLQLKRKNRNKYKRNKEIHLKSEEYSNPYMEFMKKSEKEARSWYAQPEREFKDIPVMERAEKLQNDIVKKFVENFESISKSEEVNEQTVFSIFEIMFPFPICSALNTNEKIYDAMPETTTKHLGCYEQGYRHKLLNQILKDIRASEKPPLQTAFGQNLPFELRRTPFKENPGTKWATSNADHDGIESFADVWKNITDLETTRGFCMYLLDHPEVNPPPFLMNKGMLIKKMLKKPVYLGNLEKQFESQNSADVLDIRTFLSNTNKSLADFYRRFVEITANSSNSASVGEISEINIMV